MAGNCVRIADNVTIGNARRVALRIFSGKNIFISRLSHSAECSKRIFTRGGHSGKQNFYSNNAKAARPPGRGSLAAGSYSTGFMLAGSSTAPG